MVSERPQPPAPHVVILGVPVHAVTFESLLDTIGAWVARGDRCYQVCTASPEFVMIAQSDQVVTQKRFERLEGRTLHPFIVAHSPVLQYF